MVKSLPGTNGENQRLWKVLSILSTAMLGIIVALASWGLLEVVQQGRVTAAHEQWIQSTEKDRFRSSDAAKMEQRIAQETKELWSAIADLKSDVAVHDARVPEWFIRENNITQERMAAGFRRLELEIKKNPCAEKTGG